MLKTLAKIFFIILGIDVLVFIITFSIPMDDRNPQPILDTFDWIIRHVLSFPLCLISPRFPFFTGSSFTPWIVVLTLVNNAILSVLIWYIFKLGSKLFQSNR